MFRSELELGGGTYARIAERDGRVIAYLCAVLVADEAHLGNLAVHPAEQRSGVGQLLLDDLLRTAIRHGVARLTLEVRVGNDGAQELYRRFGFAPAGIRKNYYTETNEDAIVMWAHDIDLAAHRQRLDAIAASVPGTTTWEGVVR